MSSPPSPHRVWFLLLDSVTGNPYKGTNDDAVSLPSDSDVAQFRKAVLLKNFSILNGLTTSQLDVYKNKSDFDKRNDSKDLNGQPMAPTESLGMLGSKEDRLIVAVPSSAENPNFNDVFLAFLELQQTNDVFLAFLELQQTMLERIRFNNKLLRKKEFRLSELKSYASENHILQWLIHYGMVPPTSTDLPQDAYCHLLGVQVPLKYLQCSYLFQKHWHRHARDFGLSSINSERNILILLKIFEEEFNTGRFVLLFDKQTRLIRCKIIDNKLRNKKLDKAMKDLFPDYQVGDVDFKGKTCFGDFDGEELHFLNTERPSTRCLSFHALMAREHAFGYGWIDKDELKELDDDDEDMWSDGFLDEKTRNFIDKWRADVCDQGSGKSVEGIQLSAD